MCRYVLLILLIFLINTHTEAQMSNNASGNDLSNQYGSVSYSIGEVFYIQKGAQFNVLEGIQNGTMIFPGKMNSRIKVFIYPNPTTDFVYFKIQDLNFNNLTYSVYNNIGYELLKGRIQNTSTTVSLSQLPASIYIFKIIC